MAHGDGLRQNRYGVWYWRWVVPAAVRQSAGGSEFSVSLGTARRGEAVTLSLHFRLLAARFLARSTLGDSVPSDDFKRTLERAKAAVNATLRRERSDEDFIEAHAARVKAVMALDEARADHAEQLTSVVVSMAKQGAALPAPVKVPLSDVTAAFEREHLAKDNWSVKTRSRWQVTFRLLSEALGNPAIQEVRREHLTDFLARLRRLPANAQKKQGLKGLSFLELTAIGGHDTISGGTVKDHMTRVNGFFKWVVAVGMYGVTLSPSAGLSAGRVKRSQRRPFTHDELAKLFRHENFATRTFLHPHYYWLLPLGLLTGMRLSEACQLRLADFIDVDGVDVIRCVNLDEGLTGKSDAATRRIPVHRDLIRLGLLRWVAKLRTEGHVQLFPEIQPGRDGYGHAASKWFQRYRASCGATGKQTTVFHSLRHGFISQRLNAGVQQHQIAEIAGHETGMITGEIYWSDRDVHALRDSVVDIVSIPADVLALIPNVEDVSFSKPPRRPPSRLGTRKSREKRVADAASRKRAPKKSRPV